MAAVIEATQKIKAGPIGTGETYDAYKAFCQRAELRPLTGRAFGDLISELDIYSLLRSRVLSRGRYGRTREIVLDLPQEVIGRLYSQILQNFEMQD
jgi:cell division control protein 6